MIRATIAVLVLIFFLAFNSVDCEDQPLYASVELVEDFSDFLAQNPDAKPLETDSLTRGQLRYRLGNRITGKEEFIFLFYCFRKNYYKFISIDWLKYLFIYLFENKIIRWSFGGEQFARSTMGNFAKRYIKFKISAKWNRCCCIVCWSSCWSGKITQSLIEPLSAITFRLIQKLLQSSNVGQAYVTAGGIGQRQITVAVQANQTLFFRHNSQIFGY